MDHVLVGAVATPGWLERLQGGGCDSVDLHTTRFMWVRRLSVSYQTTSGVGSNKHSCMRESAIANWRVGGSTVYFFTSLKPFDEKHSLYTTDRHLQKIGSGLLIKRKQINIHRC